MKNIKNKKYLDLKYQKSKIYKDENYQK